MPAETTGLRARLRRFWQKLRESTPYLVISGLLLLFVIAYLFHRIFIIVPAGHAGVLYRTFGGGTDIVNIFPEGLQIIWPFNDMTIYDVRVQEVDQDFEVLTSDGLLIETTMSIRFRPTRRLLGMLHKEHGPNYIDSYLLPELGSSARRVVGTVTPIEFYSTDRDSVEAAIDLHLRRELRELDEFFYTEWPPPPGYDEEIDSAWGDTMAERERRTAVYDSLNVQLVVSNVHSKSLRERLKERGAVDYLLSMQARYDSLEDAFETTLARHTGARALLFDTEVEEATGFDDLHIDPADGAIRARVDSLRRASEALRDSMRLVVDETEAVLEQFDRFFTVADIHDVLVKNIKLPDKIVQAIESKLEQEQVAEEFVFRLIREEREAERKRIEAEGIRDFQEIIATGITPGLLKWKGIEATLLLAESANAKVVVIGAGDEGLPLILGRDQ